MFVKFLCLFCVWILFSFRIQTVRCDVKILSKFEFILAANSNYNFTCLGDNPIKWEVPDPPFQVQENWTTFVQALVPSPYSNYTYASTLYIINMTYIFTGFFYCIDAFGNRDKMYIFVDDMNHLSIEPDNKDLVATQYQQILIPCRPTHPAVKVNFAFELEEKDLNDKDSGYEYNMHYGIFSNDTSTTHDFQFYTCTFSRENMEPITSLYSIRIEEPIAFLSTPILKDINNGHTEVNQNLVIQCIIEVSVTVNFAWMTPSGSVDLKRMNVSDQEYNNGYVTSNLTIFKATKKDRGLYECIVNDLQNHSVSSNINIVVYDSKDHFIKFSGNIEDIVVNPGEIAAWKINITAHPIPIIKWFDNNNYLIRENSSDFLVFITPSEAYLKIKHVDIEKIGVYTLHAENFKGDNESLQLFLNVTDKPTVDIIIDDFHVINKVSTVKCLVGANPKPSIYWEFKSCDTCEYEMVNNSIVHAEGLKFTSFVNISSDENGYIKCSANNSIGQKIAEAGYYISDVKNGFDIFDVDDTININIANEAEIANGETLSIVCGAAKNNYTNIGWFFNNQNIESSDYYQLEKSETKYSKRLRLTIPRVSVNDSGYYTCSIVKHEVDTLTKSIYFAVKNATSPILLRKMEEEKKIIMPEKAQLECLAYGLPKPTITWYKNDKPFNPYESRIELTNYNQKIIFSKTDIKDEGTYSCKVKNKIGITMGKTNLIITNKPVNNLLLITIIIVIASFLIIVLVMLIHKHVKEKNLEKELKMAGLSHFENGALENINPDLGIDEQAELLPYDKKWEFPIEDLKLGKQLGSGEFGVVMKGIAKHIEEGEESTIVAVKKVKKNANPAYIKALASELKIMVHLGKHLNVVNLLGACTKNVVKRELLVIVEYCRYGNLHNYLYRHRESFVDQLDSTTGTIDYTIGQDILERSYAEFNRERIQKKSHPMVDYRENQCNIGYGENQTMSMSNNSEMEESICTSGTSIQPEWRSNYKGDYKGMVKPICTKDLLTWAFQVSRGMEYLASRKVLHGDLAARNILLSDNNIVKICDFGLAKSMYKDDNYKKQGDGPLPIKWMAIESIRDRVFSTQSDVWAFGVVLWEFFSLARTPYPGMPADEKLFHKLVEGYRMESPEYCPKEMYKMMRDCWHFVPTKRPTFTSLTERLGSFLEDSVRRHYIDLNDPYLLMNTQRLMPGQNDYLAMLSPPDFENLSTPNYTQDHEDLETDSEGYLSMKSAGIFSPRPEDHGKTFNFPSPVQSRCISEEGSPAEMQPMLDVRGQSATISISNPSYHIPPSVSERNDCFIAKSSDNYVNMPQNKQAVKNKNHKVRTDSEKENEHTLKHDYVNNFSRDWENIRV